MIFTTLDISARRYLLQKGLPIHWYVETLTHMAAALRELSIDTLQIINTVVLTPNEVAAAPLPCDFMEECGMFVAAGQYLSQMVRRDNITPLVNYSTTGQPVLYGNITAGPVQSNLPLDWPGGSWYWNINDLGESIGRLFGYDTTLFNPNGYKIIKERGQVQFTETNTQSHYVFMYISDGQSVTNASQITPMAINALEAWVSWKRSPNADNPKSPEGFGYYNAKRNLRSRLNDMDTMDIKQIIRANYQDAPKT